MSWYWEGVLLLIGTVAEFNSRRFVLLALMSITLRFCPLQAEKPKSNNYIAKNCFDDRRQNEI
jgi:hypothetical protein